MQPVTSLFSWVTSLKKNKFFCCRGKRSLSRFNDKPMEENRKFDELLIAYLAGELSAEEEKRLVDGMAAEPQGRGAFERIKDGEGLAAAKQALSEIDLEQEWRRMEQTLVRHGKGAIERAAEVPFESTVESWSAQKGRVRRLALATAVAASVLFLLWLGWGVFNPHRQPASPLAAGEKGDSGSTVPFRVAHTYNNSGKARHLVLEDGSTVVLEDQSQISYAVPFQNSRRDISLKGKAFFKVAKDSARPFTVYSGDLRTTALGTEFSVTHFEADRFIVVRLQEGKVAVQSVDSMVKKLRKAYYLKPGQELVYDRGHVTATVRNYKAVLPRKRQPEKRALDNPSLPEHTGGTWYMFNNQPLPEIFDQLESMFGVRIDYKRKELERLYFIGKFDKEDSLDYILQNIATINKLKLSRTKKGYMINR
jgi:transmembrane sensor